MDKIVRKKIGILGAGALGGAVARGLGQRGFNVSVFDTNPEKGEALASFGVHVSPSSEELCCGNDIIMAAIKPYIFFPVLRPLETMLENKLCVSLAGGISLDSLKNAFPNIRWARAMTNICAAVNRAFTGYVLPETATDEESGFLAEALQSLGEAVPVQERLFDAITAISGSGPAFYFSFFDAFLLAGVRLGLPADLALKATAWTAAGASELVLQSGKHPAALRDEVSTPGGTTIEGVSALHEGGVPAAIIRCISKTAEKSESMSQKAAESCRADLKK